LDVYNSEHLIFVPHSVIEALESNVKNWEHEAEHSPSPTTLTRIVNSLASMHPTYFYAHKEPYFY
jgi:hypothetical protein